jgi:ribosomal protein S18 acetylase RimI-like enzyme
MPYSISSPTIQEKEDFKWQGIARNDLADIWKLFQIKNRVADAEYTESMEDMHRQFDDPWSNPQTEGRVVRTLQGKLAAFARIFVNPKPEKENVAYLWCEVAPEASEEGLEQECLDWMQERATECLAEAAEADEASTLPRMMRTDFPESNTNAIALYRANGFTPIRKSFKMERDLSEPIPDAPLPDGLVIRTYSPELDEAMLETFNASFSDHWGHQTVTPNDWHQFLIDYSDVRHDLTFAVMDGDKVVALCINRVKSDENERLGVKRGWIGNVGTLREYRKRGIASALIAESMRRFRAEGFEYVGLGVDAENPTGALGLYERLGFYPVKTRVTLEKRVY